MKQQVIIILPRVCTQKYLQQNQSYLKMDINKKKHLKNRSRTLLILFGQYVKFKVIIFLMFGVSLDIQYSIFYIWLQLHITYMYVNVMCTQTFCEHFTLKLLKSHVCIFVFAYCRFPGKDMILSHLKICWQPSILMEVSKVLLLLWFQLTRNKNTKSFKLDPFEICYKRTTAWIETKHDRNRPYTVLIACPTCMYLSAPQLFPSSEVAVS